MGAFCRHAAVSSRQEDHTRFLCSENSTAYNYSFDHAKRAATVCLHRGFAVNYRFGQRKEAVRTAGPRNGLSDKFLFYSFSFFFFEFVHISTKLCCCQDKQIIPGTAFIIASKVEVLCSVCFGPRQLPKDGTSKVSPRLTSEHHPGFLTTVSSSSGPASPFISPLSSGSPNISRLGHMQGSHSRK